MPRTIRIDITSSEHVSAIAYPAPSGRRLPVCLVLAHGAGANQTSGFMVTYASALAARGIAAVTFNFQYTEIGRRIPDRNDKLEACYRKVVQSYHAGAFQKVVGSGKLVMGGKSMGGRIASQVAATEAEGISGLVFLGYPLHPPGRPEQLRAKHLPSIRAPMLFVQGARDAFGTPEELRPVLRLLKPSAELCIIEGGDHSFKVAKRAGQSQEQVHEFVLNEIERWLRENVLDVHR